MSPVSTSNRRVARAAWHPCSPPRSATASRSSARQGGQAKRWASSASTSAPARLPPPPPPPERVHRAPARFSLNQPRQRERPDRHRLGPEEAPAPAPRPPGAEHRRDHDDPAGEADVVAPPLVRGTVHPLGHGCVPKKTKIREERRDDGEEHG